MCVIVMVNCVGVDFYLDSFFHFCLLFILVVFACICMGKNSQVIGDRQTGLSKGKRNFLQPGLFDFLNSELKSSLK